MAHLTRGDGKHLWGVCGTLRKKLNAAAEIWKARETVSGTNLVRPYVADVQVGVAGGWVDAVLLKVLTDVVWGGLRQQPVNTLPEIEIQSARGGTKSPTEVFH